MGQLTVVFSFLHKKRASASRTQAHQTGPAVSFSWPIFRGFVHPQPEAGDPPCLYYTTKKRPRISPGPWLNGLTLIRQSRLLDMRITSSLAAALFCFVFFVDDRRIFRIHHDRLLGAGHLRVL